MQLVMAMQVTWDACSFLLKCDVAIKRGTINKQVQRKIYPNSIVVRAINIPPYQRFISVVEHLLNMHDFKP